MEREHHFEPPDVHEIPSRLVGGDRPEEEVLPVGTRKLLLALFLLRLDEA